MKRTPIRKISSKQAIELKRRHNLKQYLLEKYGEVCQTCNNKNRDWRGLSLSHITALSRGGKTTEDNCLLECYPCHEKYEKRPELRGIGEIE